MVDGRDPGHIKSGELILHRIIKAWQKGFVVFFYFSKLISNWRFAARVGFSKVSGEPERGVQTLCWDSYFNETAENPA